MRKLDISVAKALLSDQPLKQVQDAARAQNGEPAEIVSEAVRKYLDDQRWERLVMGGEKSAQERGFTEADVPRLIEEVRREKRTRGR